MAPAPPVVAPDRLCAWRRARNILCIRLDSLGDVLMTEPALRALKEDRPDRRLTLLTSASGAAIAPYLPALDRCITYDAPWLKATAPRADSGPELAMVDRLRELDFDAAILFTVFSQNPLPSAFLCYLADIPLRLAWCREKPYQLLSDHLPDPEPAAGIRHEVRRQLDLVAAIGCRPASEAMQLALPETARRRASALLTQLGVDDRRPWAVLHPGATAASRRYPAEHFAAVGRALLRQGWQLLFTGSAEEAALVQSIQGALVGPAWSLAGRLDLGGTAALLERAPLLISNNTGPAHLAAAVGTPVIDLYALTNPQHTPWAVPHRVLYADVPCKYCYKSVCPEGHHRCLRDLEPARVVDEALALHAQCQRQSRPSRAAVE